MINYKEFEVIKAMLCKGISDAKEIFENTHHYVFKNIDEVESLIEGLEYKGYVANGTITAVSYTHLLGCNNSIRMDE